MEGVIIRADGTREELGIIAYHHVNPFKRLAWRLGRLRLSIRNRLKRKAS